MQDSNSKCLVCKKIYNLYMESIWLREKGKFPSTQLIPHCVVTAPFCSITTFFLVIVQLQFFPITKFVCYAHNFSPL